MGNLEFFNELASKGVLSNARTVSLDFDVYTKTFLDIDRKLKFQSGDRVLDLGGGTGQITYLISKIAREVTLADGAPAALELAKKNLGNAHNVEFRVMNLEHLPLPFMDTAFDKVVCYSVVHYLSSRQQFVKLVLEMLRITREDGKVLIGDIPLADKGRRYLEDRQKRWIENLMGNIKYYFIKSLTGLRYRMKNIDEKQVAGLAYTRQIVEDLLSAAGVKDYKWVLQDIALPFANSREDLMIVKKL